MWKFLFRIWYLRFLPTNEVFHSTIASIYCASMCLDFRIFQNVTELIRRIENIDLRQWNDIINRVLYCNN